MRMTLGVFASTALILSACDMTGGGSSSSGNSQNNSNTGQAAIQILATSDQAAADSTVQAIQNLPDKVGGRLTASARANLTSANSSFRSDLLANSSNTAANFGLAVTSLALKMDDFSDSLQSMSDDGLLGGDAGSIFNTTATKVVENQVVASRALASTSDPATIRQLQASIETGFLPTVDSVVNLLTTCWNNTNFTYRFPVSGFSDKDSLTIGRGDVGIALAGVMAVRAYLVWFVSQDLSVEVPGQGFPNSVAWYDTLDNINDSTGPQGTYQAKAFQNLKDLYSGTFLSVRSGYASRVNPLPSQLVSAAAIAKNAAYYAYQYQPDLRHGLVHIGESDYNSFAGVMDSVSIYLSGPHNFIQPAHTELEYPDSTCTYTSGSSTYTYSCSGSASLVKYPGYSVRVDVAKLITMQDHKVFLPEFQWNDPSVWPSKGPFSLLSGSTVTKTYRQLRNMDVNSPLDLKGVVVWKDPTFSGTFPSFASSDAVLTKLDSLDEKPISSSKVAGRLLPRVLGL
jgi:hypothetical protein